MVVLWEVTGGSDSGGIVVRDGRDLKSATAGKRLAHGCVVKEIALVGDRLNYELVQGSGPNIGWVSVKVKATSLLVRRDPQEEAKAGPNEAQAQNKEDHDALQQRIVELHQASIEEGSFEKYFLKYTALGYPLQDPQLRVLCFHGAGSAESMYTQQGTSFLDWAKKSRAVEVCAVDFPGRNKLLQAPKITSASRLAEELLAVFYEKMTDGVPYIIWGHSVGAWVAFEFLVLARKAGLSMPLEAFLIAFPAPHLPENERAWHRNKSLSDHQFQDEVRNWDRAHFAGAGAIVFDKKDWATSWEPLLRADFTLFDEYRFVHSDIAKFSFPIHAWHAGEERYHTAEQVELWKAWTSGDFDFRILEGMGPLACTYKSAQKEEYYGRVASLMQKRTG